MNPELPTPQNRLRDKIKAQIARVIFGAAKGLDKEEK